MHPHPNHLRAILWVLGSTGLFALIFAAAKFADGAVGTFQILLLRYAGSLITVSILARRAGPLRTHKSAVPWLHFVRAVCGCCAGAAITWSSAHMPIADASAIGMLYGVFTVGLGIAFLNERVHRRQAAAVTLSLIGATFIMVSQGAFGQSIPIFPAMIALLSAALMAAEGLFIRILSQRDTAISMMLHIGVFGIALMAVPAALEWKTLDPMGYVICIGLGPVAVLAQYCTIRGYKSAPLSVVGPVDYSWLLFAILLGIAFFDETPDVSVIAGGGLIILGGCCLSGAGRKRKGKVPQNRNPT